MAGMGDVTEFFMNLFENFQQVGKRKGPQQYEKLVDKDVYRTQIKKYVITNDSSIYTYDLALSRFIEGKDEQTKINIFLDRIDVQGTNQRDRFEEFIRIELGQEDNNYDLTYEQHLDLFSAKMDKVRVEEIKKEIHKIKQEKEENISEFYERIREKWVLYEKLKLVEANADDRETFGRLLETEFLKEFVDKLETKEKEFMRVRNEGSDFSSLGELSEYLITKAKTFEKICAERQQRGTEETKSSRGKEEKEESRLTEEQMQKQIKNYFKKKGYKYVQHANGRKGRK